MRKKSRSRGVSRPKRRRGAAMKNMPKGIPIPNRIARYEVRCVDRIMTVCGPVVVNVTDAETTVVGPCPETEVGEQVASAGRPLHVMLIVLVKLLEVTIPKVALPDPPTVVMVTKVGHETTAKPGWIVKLTGAVLLLEEKLESPA